MASPLPAFSVLVSRTQPPLKYSWYTCFLTYLREIEKSPAAAAGVEQSSLIIHSVTAANIAQVSVQIKPAAGPEHVPPAVPHHPFDAPVSEGGARGKERDLADNIPQQESCFEHYQCGRSPDFYAPCSSPLL